ncbi:hypothetical protein BGZ46_007560 [Entomortierella lignicola]|nr:hypothetical protein BGZ46_007560 [Entomortierella lignicola]
MFLVWTLFFINSILVTTRFLVVTAVGSILAIYSRLRGEHANSIRWVRQGGYLEMFSFLFNTRKEITIQAKAALLFTIVATLTAGLAGRGAVHFVEPTTRQTNTTFFAVTSKQYMPLSDPYTIGGWSRNIFRGDSLVDTMISVMNDTKATKVIPDAVNGRVYTPQTFNSKVGCEDFGVTVIRRDKASYHLRNGCANIYYTALGSIDPNEQGLTVINRSDSRWSISLPATVIGGPSEVAIGAEILYNKSICGIFDLARRFFDKPKDGLSSLPKTALTKCYQSGHVVSVVATMVRFMTTKTQLFSNVSRSIFDEYNELFQAMEITINNKAGLDPTMFAEVKLRNNTLYSLTCFTAPNPSSKKTAYLTCAYVINTCTILEKQDLDPTIVASLGGEPIATPSMSSTIMSFIHLPSVNESNFEHVSLSELEQSNLEAANYLASLGHNLLVDWDRGQVTVMFKIADAEEGLEIPLWLILCVPIIATISAILIGSTEFFLDGRYTGSLYKSIAMSMRTRMNTFAPMLMRSKIDPVEFEGVPVVPSGHRFEADPNSVATLRSEANYSTATLNE